ncbi:MAG: MFS transporter, partial [Candidatus Omnitrophica bacterium]|nr:MFS transporter [Candidatus Omnitrophota bacterium]
KASFFILCPVNVLILFMAVYLTKVFGLQEAGLVNVLAIAAVFAIFGSIIFGTISDYLGYKNTIYFISSMLFSGFILIALFTAKIHAFWLAGLFGLIYGALMAVPRALAVSLVPDKKIGELFGFLAVIGYLAGIVGPLFWGLMLLILRPLGVLRYRIVIVSLVLFIIPALYYFIRIPKRKLQHEQ